MYLAGILILRKVDQKHLESFEMWCCRGMTISCTDRVKNLKNLRRFKDDRYILHRMKRRKASCIGLTLRRHCFLKYVTEGKIEGRID